MPLFDPENPDQQRKEAVQRAQLNDDDLRSMRIVDPSWEMGERVNTAINRLEQMQRDRGTSRENIEQAIRQLEKVNNLERQTRDIVRDTVENRQKARQIQHDSILEKERELDIEKRMRAMEKDGVSALREEARLVGIRSEGRYHFGRRVGENAMSEEEFRRMASQREAHPDYGSFRQQMMDERAIRLERGKPTFSVGEVFRAVASGNIGAAVGELLQRPDFAPVTALNRGAGSLGASLEQSSIPGAGALGRAIPGAVGYALTPAAAYGAYRLFNRYNRLQQDLQLQGMAGGLQGGEAIREGLEGRFQARVMGLNPFDIMTTQMAREIASGVRSRGFRGEVAKAWTETVGDVVSDLGISASAALESMNVAVEELGMNTNEFRDMMDSLDEVAKSTGDSVENVRQRTIALSQALAQTGGQAAGQLGDTIVATIQGAVGRGPARGALAQAVGQPQALAALQPMFGTGEFVSPFDVEGQIRQFATIMDNMKARLLANQRSSGIPLAQYATILAGANMFNLGMNAAAWEDFLKAGSFREAQGRQVAAEARAAESAGRRRGGLRGFLGGVLEGASGAAGWVGDQPLGPLSDLARGAAGVYDFGAGIGINTARGRNQYITRAAEQLVAAGIPQDQRREMLRGLWQARGESGESFQRASQRFSDQATREIVVRLEPNPELRRLIRTNSTAYNDYVTGRGGSQYTEPPPAIQPRNEQ